MPADERVLDLLTEQATVGLDAAASEELHAALRRLGVHEEDVSLELPAAALAVAFVGSHGPMHPPAALMDKLHAAGQAWCENVAAQQRMRIGEGSSKPATSPARDATGNMKFPTSPLAATRATERANAGGARWLPWLAAAAGITLAALAWMPKLGMERPAAGPIAAAKSDPNAVHLPWGDWDNPEQKGVTGEVVWSEAKQAGYMKFVGLKPNDPGKEQYQLWIIDSRGMQQRISGAIFDAASGETIVPIKPGIPVNGAAAFALTIEKPGGVWVSDMTRRVVIAAKKS
jgi:hypothetical protein